MLRIVLAVCASAALLSCGGSKPMAGAVRREVPECSSIKYEAPTPVRGRLVVRVKSQVRMARPTTLCISLDDRLVNPESATAKIADIDDHVDFATSLGGERQQIVSLYAELEGGDALRGYRFAVSSTHEIPTQSSRGIILAELYERPDPRPERRLSVRWTNQLEGDTDAGPTTVAPAVTP